MFENLMIVAGIAAVLWLSGYGFYLYTSRQQRDIAQEIDALEEMLVAPEPDLTPIESTSMDAFMLDTNVYRPLREQIGETFNEEELRTLCFDMGISYEDLGARGRAANIRELIEWAIRYGQLDRLQNTLVSAKPHIIWSELFETDNN